MYFVNASTLCFFRITLRFLAFSTGYSSKWTYFTCKRNVVWSLSWVWTSFWRAYRSYGVYFSKFPTISWLCLKKLSKTKQKDAKHSFASGSSFFVSSLNKPILNWVAARKFLFYFLIWLKRSLNLYYSLNNPLSLDSFSNNSFSTTLS